MSATNRGTKRQDSDFYITPIGTIQRLFDNHTLGRGDILEPSAGSGNFIKVLKEYNYNNFVTAVEKREVEYENLKHIADEVFISNFLTWSPSKDYKYIIGNPPYSFAKEFVEHCFEISSYDTEIIMLLRIGFLESAKRFDFWQEYPVSKLLVLSDRPKFINNKSDFSAYAFFIWNKDKKQEIQII